MLTRRFSPFHFLLITVNGIIGSAWLFAPLYAAKIAGSGAIISWIIGGFGTMLIALTFAELSTTLPIAGGTTRFAQLTQGVTTGFMISWVSWLSCVTMPPIEVQAVLQYASTYCPSLMHTVNNIPVLSHFGLLIATLVMLGLCVLNIASLKGFIRFNFFIFGFKFLVIVLVIIMLIHTKFHPENFSTLSLFYNPKEWELILSAVGTGGIAFAFTGFKHGVELAGEACKTKISIPLSIVGSVAVCLILYVGLQIAFIGAMSHESLQEGWANVHFADQVGPFAGIILALGIIWLLKLLLIDAAVSPLGAGLVYVTSTSRIVYAMSKSGYLPTFLSRMNKNNLPMLAIFFNFIIGMFLFLPLPGWQNMVSFLVSAIVISYAMGPIALMSLRKQLPDAERPFRLPCATPISFLAFYFCNLIGYWTGWETIGKLMIAVVIGFVIFLIACVRKSEHFHNGFHFKACAWLAPYLAGLGVISYYGNYGHGKNVLPFGWDFLIVAVFSLVIFILAIYMRVPARETAKQFARYQKEQKGMEQVQGLIRGEV
ncbi:MAG: APC family permease [Coxiellaceae bacterium]|nr:APC family permease [Coxiellaceae bacterium]